MYFFGYEAVDWYIVDIVFLGELPAQGLCPFSHWCVFFPSLICLTLLIDSKYMELSIVNVKGTSHLLREECWGRGAVALSPHFREEKWSPRDSQENMAWIGPHSFQPNSLYHLHQKWGLRRTDRIAATIGQSPLTRRKEAPLLMPTHLTVIENLIHVRCGANTVCVCVCVCVCVYIYIYIYIYGIIVSKSWWVCAIITPIFFFNI